MSARTCPECARQHGPRYVGPCAHGMDAEQRAQWENEERAAHDVKAAALAARLAAKYPAHNFRTDEACQVAAGDTDALVVCWSLKGVCCTDPHMSIEDARESAAPADHGISDEDAAAICDVNQADEVFDS